MMNINEGNFYVALCFNSSLGRGALDGRQTVKLLFKLYFLTSKIFYIYVICVLTILEKLLHLKFTQKVVG